MSIPTTEMEIERLVNSASGPNTNGPINTPNAQYIPTTAMNTPLCSGKLAIAVRLELNTRPELNANPRVNIINVAIRNISPMKTMESNNTPFPPIVSA